MPEPMPHVLEVGGSHATAAKVRFEAEAPSIDAMATTGVEPSADADALLDAFAQPVRALEQTSGVQVGPDDAWVVLMPGPFDYERGIGHFRDVGKFDSLRDVSVRDGLASRLDILPERVLFVNDAVAYGLGEDAYSGRPRPDRHVCLTLGTGVGSVFIERGGVVDSGDIVPFNGWVYTIEWNGRPLEESVSTRAITRSYARRSGQERTVKQIALAAAEDDEIAADTITDAMHALGAALGPWLRRFDASRLTLGGAISQSWDLLQAGLHSGLAAGSAPPGLEVVPSRLLGAAPIFGAVQWFRSTARIT